MIPWIESISAVFLWIRNLFNKGCSVTTSVRLRLTSQTNQVAVDSELNLVMDSALTVEVSCFRGVRLGYKTWRLEVSYQFLPEPVINFKSLVKIRDKFPTFFSFTFVVLAINRPDITDTEMETVMDTIVDSLFCFFVTLGKFSNLSFSKVNKLFNNSF